MRDTQAGNIVLATCRNNDLFEWAEEAYNGMKDLGLLDVAKGKDIYSYTVDGHVRNLSYF